MMRVHEETLLVPGPAVPSDELMCLKKPLFLDPASSDSGDLYSNINQIYKMVNNIYFRNTRTFNCDVELV